MTPAAIETLEARRLLAAQAYDWRNVTIKGTGFVNGIVFSAAQPGLAYANTDMGGAYRWDAAAARWVSMTDWAQTTDWSLNYMGAESLAADPTDASRVYLAMGTSYGFGGNDSAILRSTDQGRTWLRTNVTFPINGNGPGRNGTQRLQVDPNATNVLYYGTRTAGVWKSTDYGATWSKLPGFPFTSDPSGVAQNVGVGWVLVDKASSSPGTPSPVLYAAASTTGNAKIYRSPDGGATWAPIPGQPTGTTLFPIGSALSADGKALYLTYGVGDVGPNNVTNGSVYKVANPAAASPAWNPLTIDSPHGQGGWGGIAIDPTNPDRLYVTTLDRWWPAPFDQVYRSTNGGSTWTPLNPNDHRDDSSSGWSATTNLHWLLDIEVDPFDPDHVMFTTGFGLFGSANATAAAPTWRFANDGLEQSAVLELASPAGGPVNLFNAIGDQDGFRHADFAVSPPKLGQANGRNVGTNEDIDVAAGNANYVVRLTTAAPYVQYSNDNGVNWAWMPSAGLASSTGGNLAISADGTKVVYEQGGGGQVVYSTRNGSAWGNWAAPATNRPANGAKVVADLVSGQTFYAYQNTTVWRSTDGGATWEVRKTGAPAGAAWIRAVHGNAGHLLMACGGNGLWRSTDGGANWTRLNAGAVTVANEVGVGAAAPGQNYPAIFVGGTVNEQTGFFRSDDQGATWVTISDRAHQYGDVTTIQGDPRVYGRLYVGTNGRGVLYADIHGTPAALPSGWATQDLGSVASAGAAGRTAGGAWELVGGAGTGPASTSDNLRFAYTTLTGDGSITARVTGVSGGAPGTGAPKAGVMIRDSLAAGAANAFVAATPGSANGVLFHARATPGGNTAIVGSRTQGVWPPYWVRLTRSGTSFVAEYSLDGSNWTQLGSPVTLPLGQTAYVGLATTSADGGNVSLATFDNVAIAASVSGTAGNDTIAVARGAGAGTASVNVNGTAYSPSPAALARIVVAGGAGDDRVTLDYTQGDLPAWVLDGAAGGTQTLAISGASPGDAFSIAGGLVTHGTAAGSFAGLERLELEAGMFALAEQAAGAALQVAAGATAKLSGAQVWSALTVIGDGTIDLLAPTLAVNYGGGPSPAEAIRAMLAAGSNGGRWQGAGGIASSVLASDPLLLGAIAYTDDGTAVRLTRSVYGDANADLRVSADDVATMLLAQSQGRTDWSAGDFNYDTRISGDDWALLARAAAFPPNPAAPSAAAAPGFSNIAITALLHADADTSPLS